VLSLTFALMAVYYATNQQRILGRFLKAKDIRIWIRGGQRKSALRMYAPGLDAMLSQSRQRDGSIGEQDSEQARNQIITPSRPGFVSVLRRLASGIETSDPHDYNPDLSRIGNFKTDIINHCFTPGVASVITISAPQGLLSASLTSLLISLGVYLYFIWHRDLDGAAGHHDSRNVFILYVIGVVVGNYVYSISTLFQDDETRSERQIVEAYLEKYIATHHEVVARWGNHTGRAEDGIPLDRMGNRNGEQTAELQRPQEHATEG